MRFSFFLSSTEKISGALGEYVGNRVGEILNNQVRLQKFCPIDKCVLPSKCALPIGKCLLVSITDKCAL